MKKFFAAVLAVSIMTVCTYAADIVNISVKYQEYGSHKISVSGTAERLPSGVPVCFMVMQDGEVKYINTVAADEETSDFTAEDFKLPLAKAINEFTLRADMGDNILEFPVTVLRGDKDNAGNLTELATEMEALSGESLTAAMEELMYFAGISDEMKKVYSDWSDSLKEAYEDNVTDILAETKKADLQKAFKEQMILISIVKDYPAQAAVTLMDVCEISEIDGFDKVSYSKLTAGQVENVISSLVGGEYTSVDTLIDDINEGMQALTKSSSNGGSGSSSGRGSSSKSGSGNVGMAPVIILPEVPVADEEDYFTDLGDIDWAKDAINTLADRRIINGRGDGTFGVSDNITRAEFVKILMTAYNLQSENSVSFADVGANAWYCEIVGKAAAIGLVNGDGGKFNPETPITRQDAAVMMHRALGIAGKTATGNKATVFADSENISGYAKEAVESLANAEIINGYPDGSFAPLKNITRAEAAVMIYKTVK